MNKICTNFDFLINNHVCFIIVIFLCNLNFCEHFNFLVTKGKVHPCTGTEALYRLYGP